MYNIVMVIRVFIGISKIKNNLRYATSLYINNQGYPLDPKTANNSWDNHKVTLVAIRDILQELVNAKKDKYEVIYYCNDDLVSFEWEVQYKQDKHFTEQIKDVDVWQEIIKIIENHDISLTIRGKSNILEKMNKKEKIRAKRT